MMSISVEFASWVFLAKNLVEGILHFARFVCRLSRQDNVVGEVEGGKILSEKETTIVRFRNFESLDHARNSWTWSSPFSSHGYLWKLQLYPGGSSLSDENEVRVSIFLCLLDKEEVHVKYSIQAAKEELTNIKGKFSAQHNNWGCHDSLCRDCVLERNNGFLNNGTLQVKVDIQVYSEVSTVWTPPKTLHLNLLKMLESGEKADITFRVDDQCFRAHGAALLARAPDLASLMEGFSDGTEIEIQGVDDTLFWALLYHAYSDDLPSNVNIKENARALLEVANKFGCESLKLAAEAVLVSSGITVDNAEELLLLADSMSCALLKEAVTEFVIANRRGVCETEGYSKLKESSEKMSMLFDYTHKRRATEDETNPDLMRVTVLRKKAEERGLDVGGTKEMLVKRLKTSEEDN